MAGMEKRQLAKSIEDGVEELLGEMTGVLRRHGFEGVKVVSFAVGESSVCLEMADGTPCPVRCVVLPDGRVRCEPQC